MPGVFITATGTEVGKTFVTTGLIAACARAGRRVTALKPIASGFDASAIESSDTAILLDALARPITADAVASLSPWRFRAPLSPDMAAALENRAIDFEAVVEFCRRRLAAAETLALIEGVGGVMVPLGPGRTVLDWIAALRVPIVLVSPTGLGAISHLLTAVAVLELRGQGPAAIVLSEMPDSTVPIEGLLATLSGFCAQDTLFVLRRAPEGQAEIFDALLARVDPSRGTRPAMTARSD